MAAGVTFKPKRKAGAFSGGELASGEVGLDTTNGVWYYSSDGSTVTALGGGGGGAAKQYKRLSADFARTTASYADVDNGSGDNLVFSVSADTVYQLEVVGACSSGSVGEAILLGVNGPTANWVMGEAAFPNASLASPYTYRITSYDYLPALANGPGATAHASIRMNVVVSIGGTGGSLAVRMRPESTTGATLLGGAVATLERLSAA